MLLTDSDLVVPVDDPEVLVVSFNLPSDVVTAFVDLFVSDLVAVVNFLSLDTSPSNFPALVKECFVTLKCLLFEDLAVISSLIAAVVVIKSRFIFEIVTSSDDVRTGGDVVLGSNFFHPKVLVVEVSTLSCV